MEQFFLRRPSSQPATGIAAPKKRAPTSTPNNNSTAPPQKHHQPPDRYQMQKQLFEKDDPNDPSDDDCPDDHTAPATPYGSERSISAPPSPGSGAVAAGGGVAGAVRRELRGGGGGDEVGGGGGGMVKQRSVRWSTIEFYNHEIVMGDHPSVEDGPPLSIGWKSVGRDELSIDAYENIRPERRSTIDLIVPPDVRHRWLIESGYSRSEIKDCLIELAHIQESRRKNAHQNRPWETMKRRIVQTFRCTRRPTIIEIRTFDE